MKHAMNDTLFYENAFTESAPASLNDITIPQRLSDWPKILNIAGVSYKEFVEKLE